MPRRFFRSVTSEAERIVHERWHEINSSAESQQPRKYTGWEFYERQPAKIGA